MKRYSIPLGNCEKDHPIPKSKPSDDPHLRNNVPSHPPIRDEINLETFEIPIEHFEEPHDHMIRDDDVCFENLIHQSLEPSFDIEPSHEDPFDFALNENFEENRNIFEDIPEISLETPSLGIDLVSLQFHILDDSSCPIPNLEPWVVDTDFDPHSSEPNPTFDSYFLIVAPPLPLLFDPVLYQFFRSAGITLHHQLVTLTRLLVGGPELHIFSIFWVRLNITCEPDSSLVYIPLLYIFFFPFIFHFLY